MALNPAPVTADRSFAEIIADLPDCPSQAHHALLDQIEAWLPDTTQEPPGGGRAFHAACSAALTDCYGAGAIVNSLISEFKGTNHTRGLHAKGLADLNTARGLIAEAKIPLEKAVAVLKSRYVVGKRTFWAAAPASIIALRKIDLALELWRDDEDRWQEVLDAINDAVSAYYEAAEPDEVEALSDEDRTQ